MYCENCGSNQSDGSVFCGACGAKMRQAEVQPNGGYYQGQGYGGQPNGGYYQGQGYGGQPNGGYYQGQGYGGICQPIGKEPSFFEYWKEFFIRYADFNGRTSVKGYWVPILFNVVVGTIIGVVAAMISAATESFGGMFLNGLYSLAIALPSLAASIRRMHDIGKSGWWIFVSLIPFAGCIWYLILTVQGGDLGPNKYGERCW